MSDGLVRGAAGTLIGQWARLVIQLTALAILSRILEPQVFGVYAVIIAISGIANIIGDLGLTLAAVQAQTISNYQANNLFWINTAIGLLATVVVAAAAYPAQLVLQAGAVTLPMQVLAVVFLINGIAAQFKAQLNREYRFGWIATAEVVGQFSGLVIAVVLAILGVGVWSLVAQQVMAASLTLAIIVLVSDFFPGWPRRDTSVRGFVNLGVATSGTQIVNYVSSNIDVLLVGRYLGAAVAGVYSRAFQIFALPLQQIASPLTRVAVPLFARASTDDERDKKIANAQCLMAYAIFPILAFVAGSAEPLISVLLGDNGWDAAASLLPILALGGLFQTMGSVYYWAFLASDQMTVLFRCEFVGRLFMVAMMISLVSNGAIYVALSYSTGLLIIWVVTTIWGMRALSITRVRLLRPVLRPIVLFIVVSVATRVVAHFASIAGTSSFVVLLVCLGSAISIAGLTFRCLPGFAGDFRYLRGVARRARSRPQLRGN